MVSGVLKLIVENDPSRRFNLVRRTPYLSILKGHPAIAEIGYPPKDAAIIETNYWDEEGFAMGKHRAFQVLARKFGLSPPVEERLYLPGEPEEDTLLHNFIPWGKKNILIAPSSASPRKEMLPAIWNTLVEMLRKDGYFIVQSGRLQDQHVSETYSILGLTTPRQLVALLERFDVIITSDNFVMHAAHLVGKPAVVLWGPTDHRIYGYPEHIHLQAARTCGPEVECIGPKYGDLYNTPCPLGPQQCTNQIKLENIYQAVQSSRVGWALPTRD